MARSLQIDIRDKIVTAAEERLWHYGYKKTTIDEIASDAGVGKGTVYLYFENKEEIALAIMTQFKIESIKQVEIIASASFIDVKSKLKAMLCCPITRVHERCLLSPSAQEMVIAVRPHIRVRLQPYMDQEIALIAGVLEEGMQQGILFVHDSIQVAWTLKHMCAGFWPPYPCVEGIAAIKLEVDKIVDLAYSGLQATQAGIQQMGIEKCHAG